MITFSWRYNLFKATINDIVYETIYVMFSLSMVNLKNQLEKSIFYRKNREKTEFFFLRINRISKMTTSSTPMLLLQNFLALEKSEIKFGEFEKFHWEIQSALVFMKIKSSGLRPLDPRALQGYLLYYWYFFFIFSLLQTP